MLPLASVIALGVSLMGVAYGYGQVSDRTLQNADHIARIDTVEGEKTDMKAAADAEAARAITAETSLAKVTKELDAMKATAAA